MMRLLSSLVAAFVILAGAQAALAADAILYAGSYTQETSKGIYAWRFDGANGGLSSIGLVAEAPQPAHIWIAPDGRHLYAVNWLKEGTLSAYRINRRTGALTLLNKVSAQGALPNQIVLDPGGRIAVTVNYDTGNVVAYKVLPDGKLSEAFFVDQHTGKPLSDRQPGPRAHGIAFSRDGKFMYIAQLGLDRVYGYSVDAAKGTITPGATPYVETPAGSGPRRLQISPNGKFLYVNHQDDSRVSVFAVDGTNLKPVQIISTLPADYTARNTTAEIVIDPPGEHLYVSNRGHNSIAIYDIDQTSGRLTLKANTPSGGNVPRNLRLDPTGDYLLVANQGGGPMATTQGGGNVAVFRIDHATGLLTKTGSTGEINNPGGLYLVATQSK
jgi:6-phosphogluconolactonase